MEEVQEFGRNIERTSNTKTLGSWYHSIIWAKKYTTFDKLEFSYTVGWLLFTLTKNTQYAF